MPGTAAKVLISERQKEVLEEIPSSRAAAVRLVQRAKIVLLSFVSRKTFPFGVQRLIGRQRGRS